MRAPRLFRRPLIGVDVSSRWIAVAQAEEAGAGPPTLRAAACVARVGQGNPDAAEIRRLAEVLDRRGFRAAPIVVAAPEDRLIMSALELPPRDSGAPVLELARMEVARTHKRDPGTFETALWDVPSGRPGEGPATRYMAAALPHEDAESLLAAADGAALRVRAIDVRAWALARACAPRTGPGLAALIDLGESGAVLVLVHAGVVAYQRTIAETGVDGLRAALAASLGLAPEVLEFVLGGVPGQAPDLPEGSASIIEDYVEAIAAEARAAFDYVSRRAGGAAVEQLLVVGAGARVPGMADRLGATLGLQAAVVTPGAVASCAPGTDAVKDDPRLTVALGLSMHDARSTRCAA